MSFQHYYESIYQVKSEIESHTKKSWAIPTPHKVGGLTERYEPFAWITEEHFMAWGQAGSYMVHLRHHGFPSPLLDWTRSPYIAAFFAFRRLISDKVSIFVYRELLNPTENLKSYGSAHPEIYTLKKQYFPTHPRHFLQQAEYTFCVQNSEREWCFEPHGSALGRDDPNIDVIWKFNLPAAERTKVLKLLDSMNINAFSLFGSEESLMETMAFRELDCHRP